MLFFSFLVDDSLDTNDVRQIDLLWDIYYHFYLDNAALELLRTQVDRLTAAFAAAEDSLEKWHASPYGRHLRFCDVATLQDVRSGLARYEKALAACRDKSDDYEATFRTNINTSRAKFKRFLGEGGDENSNDYDEDGEGLVVTGMRSAMPFSSTELPDLPRSFCHYWKHGTTTPLINGQQLVPNPTFAASVSDALPLHYGTDTILGYHLALTLTTLTAKSPLQVDDKVPGAFGVVRAARTEFRALVRAFREAIVEDGKGKKGNPSRGEAKLVVRMVTADALVLCYALQAVSIKEEKTCWYRRQMDIQTLQLEPGMTVTQFDVIDASNLGDQLGALNVLVATAPLLADRPWAVLLTECLLRSDYETADANDTSTVPQKAFAKLLGGHTQTVALFLGLTPVEHYTNARVEFYADEMMDQMAGYAGAGEVRCQFTWKPSHHFSGQQVFSKVHICEDDLVSMLFAVYRDMFASERRPGSDDGSLPKTEKARSPCFHRGSLVAMLRIVRKNVATDNWATACRRLLTRIHEYEIEAAGEKIGLYYTQELMLQLQLWGVYEDVNNYVVAALILEVPHSSIDHLFSKSADSSTAPIPIIRIRTAENKDQDHYQWHCFADLQYVFGTVTHSSDNKEVSIKPDGRDFTGTAPLVVFTHVPAKLVRQSQANATIEFGLHTTTDIFGAAFQTTVVDTAHVHVTTHLPGLKGYTGFSRPLSDVESPAVRTAVTVTIDPDSGALSSMTGRTHFQTPALQELLTDRSIAITPAPGPSPFLVNLVFTKKGTMEPIMLPVQFPLPMMDAAAMEARLRVARTSGWIEVVVKTTAGVTGGELVAMQDFVWPTTLLDTMIGQPGPMGLPVTLTVPHVNLDALPILSLEDKTALAWLLPLVSCAFSPRERLLRNTALATKKPHEKVKKTQTDPRVDFKDSLLTLFALASGMQGGQTGLFMLQHPSRGGGQALILVSALRLDVASGSVVADAAVLPMTHEMLEDDDLLAFLHLVHSNFEVCIITVDDAELVLWKLALPAMAERCRTWSHRSDCDYVQTAGCHIPLSFEEGDPVICACGEGQLPPDFVDVPLWKDGGQRYATRIAISPVFGDPSVEQQLPPLSVKKEACRCCGAAAAPDGSPLKRCMRCRVVKYCSAACQKKDWRTHRRECKEADDADK